MKFSATSLALIAALLFNLTACGGGGSSNEQDLRSDLNLSEQKLNSTHAFFTKIVPESFLEAPQLNISRPLLGSAYDAYLISTLDQAKTFNEILPPEERVEFNDLETSTYFLIAAPDCPVGSVFDGAEYAGDQVTIRVKRYDATGNTLCLQPPAKRFHVFKAAKLHAPEILFESVSDMPVSMATDTQEGTLIIDNEAAWSGYWATRYSQWPKPPALPLIDFTQNKVVGVYLGSRASGCYSIGIDRIYQTGEKNIVEYTAWNPPGEAICTQAITYPIHIVTMPRSNLPFEFIKAERDYQLPKMPITEAP